MVRLTIQDSNPIMCFCSNGVVMKARIPWESRTSCLKVLLGSMTEESIITSQILGCELLIVALAQNAEEKHHQQKPPKHLYFLCFVWGISFKSF